MGSTSATLITVTTALIIGFGWHYITLVPELPDLPLGYWGPGKPKPDDTKITKFVINVPENVITDLKNRLNNLRELPKPLEGVKFNYGFNSQYLSKVLNYWKDKYDWSERQKYLNKYPQFTTQIAGLKVHFLHVKPEKTAKPAIPLLLLHGWPGSVREFYEFIPKLTSGKGDEPVFEVIAPSLIGYGWSEGSSKPGLGPAQMSNIFLELMKRLGHKKFYIQGGDWGSMIGASLAILHPGSVMGYHSNMCFGHSLRSKLISVFGSFFPSLIVDSHMQESYPSEMSFMVRESGYMHIQATKPDTVGVGLTDSPAGLAAYILEKFSTWTNKKWIDMDDGGLENSPYGMNALLDNVMIYWVTNSITTSVRLYSEAFSSAYRALQLDEQPVTVPTGCARFQNEILFVPSVTLRATFHDLVQVNDYHTGGHFAAFELPEVLANDLKKFVTAVEQRKIDNAKKESKKNK